MAATNTIFREQLHKLKRKKGGGGAGGEFNQLQVTKPKLSKNVFLKLTTRLSGK